jgi:hypothetical protein
MPASLPLCCPTHSHVSAHAPFERSFSQMEDVKDRVFYVWTYAMYEGTTACAIYCRNLIPVAIWSCALHQLRTSKRRSPFFSRHPAFSKTSLVPIGAVSTLVLLANLVSRVGSFGFVSFLVVEDGARTRSWYAGF